VIVSASALVRHCGHARKLDRERPKSANAQAACDRGTLFHLAVDGWLKTGEFPIVADLEIQGWLDLLACNWVPPVDAVTEIAWGLSLLGDHIDVVEREPHVYVARDVDVSPLLTAGRADVAWRAEHLVVVDWKTGKYQATPAAMNLQVNAAGIALARRAGMGSYQPRVYYARDGFWDDGPVVVFGTPAYERIFADVRAAALLDETARPGEHCRACWSKKVCEVAQ
jgi:hypothetical protein